MAWYSEWQKSSVPTSSFWNITVYCDKLNRINVEIYPLVINEYRCQLLRILLTSDVPSCSYVDGDISSTLSVWNSSSLCIPAKRRTPNHPCPICGKQYINEGSLRKHMATHPEAAGLASPLRMWPCSVCQAVFTHESGKSRHRDIWWWDRELGVLLEVSL